MLRTLRIGTRGSALALAQANEVRARLAALAAPGATAEALSELVVCTTTGDQIRDRPLADIGGKGLFTREIDCRVLSGECDCAVHSMKDMETALTPGTAIAAILPRADARDALIGARALADLRPGARIGTSAVRRRAQLLALRSDLEISPLRGNVDTRLKRLEAGDFDAIILALAGLVRLGRSSVVGRAMPTDEMLPAVAQGAIAIVARSDDEATLAALRPLNDRPTEIRVTAERALLAGLDGSCRTPIAGHAELSEDGRLTLHGAFFALDGRESERDTLVGSAEAPAALGAALAEKLKARASPSLLAVLDKT